MGLLFSFFILLGCLSLKKVSHLDLHNGLLGGGFILKKKSPRTLGKTESNLTDAHLFQMAWWTTTKHRSLENRRRRKCLWKHQRRCRNRKSRKKSLPFALTVQDRSAPLENGKESEWWKTNWWKPSAKFGKLKFDKMSLFWYIQCIYIYTYMYYVVDSFCPCCMAWKLIVPR